MSTDRSGAQDEMFGIVNVEWIAATTAILGAAAVMLWQGRTAAPPTGSFYARTSMQQIGGEQANLGTLMQPDGSTKRRKRLTGLLWVQLFAPINTPGADKSNQQIGERLVKALSRPNSSGTVWLRNARIVDVPTDDIHHRLNVVADFEYDDLI